MIRNKICGTKVSHTCEHKLSVEKESKMRHDINRGYNNLICYSGIGFKQTITQ